MALLRNPRHERFAQEIAKGKTLQEAHRNAGYTGNRSTASQLKQKPTITKRISEILAGRQRVDEAATERAIEKTGITKSWVMERLRENAERAMQAKPVLGPNGEPTGEYTYQGNVANRALELIGKELGMFIDRKEQGGPGDFDNMTKEELARDLAAQMRERGMTDKQIRDFLERKPHREKLLNGRIVPRTGH